ncbi:MAG: type II secretion system F family protein, partial [Bacilli bacterium]
KYLLYGLIILCNLFYKLLKVIGKGLLIILKYISFGFIICSKGIYKMFKYAFKGFLVVCVLLSKVTKYIIYGLLFPFIYGFYLLEKVTQYNNKLRAKQLLQQQQRALAKEKNKKIEEENKKRLAEIKAKEKEASDIKHKEEKEKKEKADIYINDNVKINKKKLADYINNFFGFLGSIPKRIKEKMSNNAFSRDAKNKKDINREALLLDFDGADAKKSATKIMYKYVAKDPDGKILKGYFPAYSKVEVHSFLLSEGNEVYSIETNKWIQRIYGNGTALNKKKIKTKDLIFFTTQLSTYIKAGIPLVEALKILSRQFKDKTYSRIFRAMVYDLTMGDNFSDAMTKQGEAFPRLLINMIKASEMTGELPEALDDMADYFTETDKTHKEMVTAMAYPTIILVVAIAAVVFIMIYVVPKFVDIYSGIEGSTLPGITVFVLGVSNFLQHQYVWLILGIFGFIFIFHYLYKNVKAFKKMMQFLFMHLPIIGNVIIYNEVTMFTKTFASLLSHNVFITDSMEILNKITNNEIYKMLILDTITNLAKGERISLAFKNHWAFPVPAYEMITTGERTGQLPEMMSKVSAYYQNLHRNAVTRIKTFVEPVLIIFLTVVVGGIVLSIVLPMFKVYEQIQM